MVENNDILKVTPVDASMRGKNFATLEAAGGPVVIEVGKIRDRIFREVNRGIRQRENSPIPLGH